MNVAINNEMLISIAINVINRGNILEKQKKFDAKKALRVINALENELNNYKRQLTEPIAIVGIGCRLPGENNDSDEFWKYLILKKNAIIKVPEERWSNRQYYSKEKGAKGKICTKYGGFVKDIEFFDNSFFGITPREAIYIDPQQRMLLENSWEAFEHAGISPDTLFEEPVGCFIGVGGFDYVQYMTALEIDDITPHIATGMDNSVAAGRLAYFYGFQGPVISIDTACSSSLVAVHYACQSLRRLECKCALAGGANLLLSPEISVNFSQANMLAPNGQCKTFDSSADGYVRSEGCGIVVLKRLSDAEKDKDTIHAVIKGSAVNHDGKTNGLTAPNGPAQKKVIIQALKDAGLNEDEIDFIETHGSGTSLGDPVEGNALGDVFCKNTQRKHPLIIGAVKSNIGHLERAAGIAGLIKAVSVVKNGIVPPNINYKEINPLISWNNEKVMIPQDNIDLSKWIDGSKIRAGVSSFGFSGTNSHVILETYNDNVENRIRKKLPVKVLALSAHSENAFTAMIDKWNNFLNNVSDDDFDDVCYTSIVGRQTMKYRVAGLGRTKEDIKIWLKEINKNNIQKYNISEEKTQLTYLFAGESVDSEVILILYNNLKPFRDSMDICNNVYSYLTGESLMLKIKSNPGIYRNEFGKNSQAICLSVEYALANTLRLLNVKPTRVMLSGNGDLAGACFIEAISLDDAMRIAICKSRKEYINAINNIKLTESKYLVTINHDTQNRGNKIHETAYWKNRSEQLKKIDIADEKIGQEKVIRIKMIDNYKCQEVDVNYTALELIVSQVVDLYNLGYNISLSKLIDKEYYKKVTLPKYPFQRIKLWKDLKKYKKEHESDQIALAGNVIEETDSHVVYCCDSEKFGKYNIKEHKVLGKSLYPQAFFVNMVFSTLKELNPKRSISIIKLNFNQVMQYIEDGLKIKTKIINGIKETNGKVLIQSSSKINEDTLWQMNVTCEYMYHNTFSGRKRTEKVNTDNFKKVSHDSFYSICKNNGFEFGKSYKSIKEMYASENEIYAYVEISEMLLNSPSKDYIHPLLLDGCLHVVLGYFRNTLKYDLNKFAWLPVTIDKISLNSFNGKRLRTHAKLRKNELDDQIIADITITDEMGIIIGEVEGLKAVKRPRNYLDALITDLPDSKLFMTEWIQNEKIEKYEQIKNNRKKLIILSDKDDFGVSIIKTLPSDTKIEAVVRVGSEANIDNNECGENGEGLSEIIGKYIENENDKKYEIVNCWWLDLSQEIKQEPTKSIEEQKILFNRLLKLIRELKGRSNGKRLRLWLITRNSQPVKRDNFVDWRQAGLWGFAKALSNETPEIEVKLIDIDDSKNILTEKCTDNILTRESQEMQFAIHEGKCYVPRMIEKQLKNKNDDIKCNKNATYLITGGFGAIGINFAEHLAVRGAKSIALISRKGMGSQDIEKRLIVLKEKGISIERLRADVTNYVELKNVLEGLKGGVKSIKGIIHAAGVTDDGLIEEQSVERIVNVISPKIIGAVNIVNLIDCKNVDFIVLCSSTASLFGSVGQSSYAVGNAMLDGFSHYLRANGICSTSVNWGPWLDEGMAAEISTKMASRWDRYGIKRLTPKVNRTFFDSILKSQFAQIGVFKIEWEKFVNVVTENRAFLNNIIKKNDNDQKESTILQLIRSLPLWKRAGVVEEHLKMLIAKVIEIEDPQMIDSSKQLLEMGLDSLMTIELRSELQKRLDKPISPTLVFEYPTINNIVDYIKNEIYPEEFVQNNINSDKEQKLVEAIVVKQDNSFDSLSEKDVARMLEEELRN